MVGRKVYRREKTEEKKIHWEYIGLEALMMEKAHQQQQWSRLRLLFSFKNATIFVCLFNLFTALFILQVFFSASSQRPNSALLRYIKESEEIHRARMLPVHLIRRVREIEKEAYGEPEAVPQKDTKQTAAVDLVSRLNNFRSYSDPGSIKGNYLFSTQLANFCRCSIYTARSLEDKFLVTS
ncbi:hypothetical protein M9H77_12950 [Catharanthus roseus]|uniref:Uncharacterized protein n=1 Tax=Catharanthus roseus TaxID=4058 RepID=A0ACC0BIU8_CATRO|nr:hypothetical protein M9H77_12950 [Catharanthus roseus]